MSKNFELLRQALKDRELLQVGVGPATPNSKNLELLGRVEKELSLFATSTAPESAASDRVPLRSYGFSRDETFKLVQRVFLLPHRAAPRNVVFCGVQDGDACGWICARSSEHLADRVLGSVCVVDANLPKPSLHNYFGLDSLTGLTDAILESGPVRNFVHRIGGSNLWLMTAGTHSPGLDLHSVMTSHRLRSRLAELRAEFDYVLIEAPPTRGDFDAGFLAALADGVILVLEPNFTTRHAAREAKEDLEAGHARVLGVVLNRRPFPFPEQRGKSLPKRENPPTSS